MIHYTLYSPTNIIHHVVIDPISAAYLDSQSLFDRLHSLLSGYNITDASRWYYQDIKDRMHVIEPFIEKFTITKQSNNTIMLSIQRKKPELIIHNGSEHMARWGMYMTKISTGDLLGSGVQEVYLPRYLSGISVYSGLFFDTTLMDLSNAIQKIYQYVPPETRLIRIPGAHRIGLALANNQLVWLRLGDTIDSQMSVYQALNKYYPSIRSMQQIDIGSQKTIIVKP